MTVFDRYRRRKPGVYWYVTRRHRHPTRTEVGYVGKSRHLELRGKCHEGKCRHRAHVAKPWMDLKVRKRELRLPWWLGWDWITLSLETLLILVLTPRYNWQKNPNPFKVGPLQQIAQRAERDREWTQLYRVSVAARRGVRAAAGILLAAAVLLMVGNAFYLAWTA